MKFYCMVVLYLIIGMTLVYIIKDKLGYKLARMILALAILLPPLLYIIFN